MNRLRKAISLLLLPAMLLSLSMGAFAAPKISSKNSKEHFEFLNQYRTAAGGTELTWDDDLYESAQIRALELVEEYNNIHVRPDGTKYFSVTTRVWGENTSMGFKTPKAAMQGFKDSKAHWKNLMDDRFTIAATACAQADDGTLYWVQHFGTGKSNASWAGVKEYDLDPFNDPNVKLKKSASKAVALVDDSGKLTTSAATELKNQLASAKGSSATLTVKDAKSVSPAVLKKMAEAAKIAGKTGYLQADTLSADGKSVQGRLLLEPAKLTGRKTSIQLGVFVDSKSVSSVKSAVEKQFQHKIVYIHMAHYGTLTTRAKVTVKVSLTGLDKDNLLFYVRDKKGTLTLLEDPQDKVDSKGFLSFYTKFGGDILVTNTALL